MQQTTYTLVLFFIKYQLRISKQWKDFEANFLSDCVIISDEKVFEVDEKGIKMKVNYKVERNIGVKREIGILH